MGYAKNQTMLKSIGGKKPCSKHEERKKDSSCPK
jgi:hypothetical protein